MKTKHESDGDLEQNVRQVAVTRFGHPQGHVFYRRMDYRRPMIAHGKGIYLYDTGGKQYIDGSGGPLVVNVGHGRQEIIEAMDKQLKDAAYIHATMFTSEALETYAQALAAVVPLDEPRFYLLCSGSEVVEGALKLSRQIQMARGEHGRSIIISRSQSYHGMTLGALAVSGRPGLRSPYLSMLHNMPHVHHPYHYRYPANGEQLAGRLEECILAYGPGNVAAFIAEPISGASLGAAEPPDDYWWRVRQICDNYGVLLIADEVLVGMGRTGKWWGLQHWDVQADIVVTSKGLTGGYFPMGFIAAEGEDVNRIKSELGDFNHGGTFSHHAVGAAAGLATLHILQRENLVDNAREVGSYLGDRLRDALGMHPHIGDIRGRGMFYGMELVQDRLSKDPFPAADKVAWRIFQRAFDMGLIIYHSQGCVDGRNGDIIMLGPPLITTRDQIDEIVAILAAAVHAEMGT